MVPKPTAIPKVAQEPTIVEKINRVGKQHWSDGELVKVPARAFMAIVTVPLGGDVDLNALWKECTESLIQAGVCIEEIARADITEIPEGLRVTGVSDTEFRFEKAE